MKTVKPQTAVCLVSGGMDSLVSVALAQAEGHSLAFLHLNYGQKTERRELACFTQIADHYHIPQEKCKVVDIAFLKEIGGSSLTDPRMEVRPEQEQKQEEEGIPDTYVPFRNTHIIAVAVSWAEVIGATKIYIGAVFEDGPGYPDCRPGYYRAMNALIEEGTKEGGIEVVTPIIHMDKAQIVQKAVELKAPLHLTWSCYAREDRACGICASCTLRRRGFRGANISDPIASLSSFSSR